MRGRWLDQEAKYVCKGGHSVGADEAMNINHEELFSVMTGTRRSI